MKTTWVIGDLHGGLKALQQIIEHASPKAMDRLVFLGDYVDGWSDSGCLIDYLIELKEQYECIFVRGNHDLIFLQYLKENKIEGNWLKHGGGATMECYQNSNFDKLKHIRFLEELVDYYIDEEQRLFVHAGFTSMHGPAKEYHSSSFYWDRTLWETALSFDVHIEKDSPYFPKRFKLFKEIFIGHSSLLKYGTDQPVCKINLWNLDTGAGFKGRLTIMNIESKIYWQSDPVWELYPTEKGRNEMSFKETQVSVI